MARADAGDADTSRQTIRLIEEDDGWWTAIDEGTGVASQGETREVALANLDEAVALHTGEAGEQINDEGAFLEEIGVNPDELPEEPRELPEFMQ